MSESVAGYCPMGCGKTLFMGAGGYVTCSWIRCPNPSAAADILDDRETEHRVLYNEDGFTIRHPLRERLNEALMTCPLLVFLQNESGPEPWPGLYRATSAGADGWHFHVLERRELVPTSPDMPSGKDD